MPITQIHRVSTVIDGFSGSPYFSQMYFDAATGSPQTKVTGVKAFWNGVAPYLMSASRGTVSGEVDTIDPTTGQIVAQTTVLDEAFDGLMVDEPLPHATQALLRFTTGVWVNGRQLRGKCFIPALTENSSEGGRPVPAVRTAIASAAGELTDVNLVVYSRTHRVWQPVSGISVWELFAVLRSRRD